MDKIIPKISAFFFSRLIEALAIVFILSSLLYFLSLVSYHPDDANFLHSEKKIIINFLGFKGSVLADFIFQSIGLIGYLFTINLFIWGLSAFKNKNFDFLIYNLFYTSIYFISGSTSFSIYKDQSFILHANGNGGFVGKIIKDIIVNYFKNIEIKIILLILILISILFFILSINLNFQKFKIFILYFFAFFKKIILNLKKNKVDEYEKDKEIKEIKNDKSSYNQLGLPFKTKTTNTSNIFALPKIDFLKKNLLKKDFKKENAKEHIEKSKFLEKILLDFGVNGEIKRISHGPVVNLYEFEPAPGIKVSKIINLSDDIARNTSSVSTRVATIPGKNTVGIEIPNDQRENVFLSEIISDKRFTNNEIKLPITLGKSISGAPIIGDLCTMPHLLIAGTTGSGKSVCINTIIISLLYRHGPDKCKFILIDPKMLELSSYEGIPHLLCPVITEAKKATSALAWTVKEMENRYKLMTKQGVRNIDGYNSKNKDVVMPYIVVIVDEMSDLMLVSGKEIENYIQKLSQMARAAGIHIIMATQRPSVDVITGTIKANFPTRISFQVSSKIDSRTILGEQGAEQLLGKGDMLFMSSANRIIRIHAPFISESEIEKINSFLRSQLEPEYLDDIVSFGSNNNDDEIKTDEKKDQLYLSAIKLVKSEGKASTSLLQRKLQIGYNRAARIIDMMEDDGIVSKANHVGKREIL